ncbi:MULTISPECIES: UDP-N-acetylglucosamine 1-carboxyvinyltransferase [Clostridium]|uniref:UDP-N-acetylglucosamine 1-carboxyvinyltransferase n=1 Tax=Clostridium novyi (strain NT) TaxID=386415 RepID=A0Q2Z1_CLONN|nr:MULTISPECIES: UDP-N-acetylglucosamine 1-carboxyvinyltransferase [Clostridium]ABK60828.1 UDP-N-acetylglucosamine 1-carboxyvinyltransferase [Clostridium novyi NT]KEH86382.1 UDP-N-acetylglucosamine 1-carboxyvinyltransferase [Clostridium novyi A str. 4540]KEH87004.1 UDP-N-acetylglucosamine 1-carboxyvinyltransferase [Clostridium novyi A str. NCTC 538]KEH92342.1 UDP-N-acetylglucosamine 1-carboxyvinyltransferase [Clostridium novyi A str. GD211209]KEH94747.1 UDP-N-acetylglucosamine 1-carboxyvinyltr
MEKILIKGGKKLRGEVNISSAKNAILPIIAASILCADKCTIKNTPMLNDVFVISDVLRDLNADIHINCKDNVMTIDTKNVIDKEPNSELVRKMRASFLIMGPMIARFGKFRLSLPGGCNIGTRPIDLHLKGFSALGATINVGHGYVEASADKLVGNKIYLDFPSVGATENIMMASVFAEGQTIIENPAGEPEIQDLANFLNAMGAKVKGAGTDRIIIDGVKELKGTEYTPIPDRIEAGTFMVAAAITKSKIKLNHVNIAHLNPIIAKLDEIGVGIEKHNNSIIVNGDNNLKPADIKTMPYPGFPTDMQAQVMSLLCTIEGTSVITETIFENRFMHVCELKRMGANIKIDGRCAVIEGVNKLTGCEVKATDLRAGAALILAGLAAEGCTKIGNIYHVDRGYVNIENKLLGLGADVKRIQE